MPSEIYQEFILELYKNPINFGKIENAELKATSSNPLCGDYIEVFIKLDVSGKMVTEAKFIGTGCAISQASACLLTDHIRGKTLDKIKKMQKENVLDLIKIDLRKNPSRLKCALLSLETIKKAIETFHSS